MDDSTFSTIISTAVSIIASLVIAWGVYVIQKRDGEMKEAISKLDSQRAERSLELQEISALRTALLRNQQDAQTRMLEMLDWLSHHIKEQVEDLLMTERYPQFFACDDAQDLTPAEPVVSPDTPRLGELRLASRVIRAGETVEVLFRVDDDGINFPVPQGVRVLSAGQAIPVEKASAKFMRCRIAIPLDCGKSHVLEFVMQDAVKNANTQTVVIPLSI